MEPKMTLNQEQTMTQLDKTLRYWEQQVKTAEHRLQLISEGWPEQFFLEHRKGEYKDSKTNETRYYDKWVSPEDILDGPIDTRTGERTGNGARKKYQEAKDRYDEQELRLHNADIIRQAQTLFDNVWKL